MSEEIKHTFITGVPDQKAVPHILSPAVVYNGLVFCSGQVRPLVFLNSTDPLVQTPIDASGKVVDGGIKEMTTQCVRNLEKVLHHAGSSLKKVVKVTVFLDDMDDFAEMNEAYEKVRGAGSADWLQLTCVL